MFSLFRPLAIFDQFRVPRGDTSPDGITSVLLLESGDALLLESGDNIVLEAA